MRVPRATVPPLPLYVPAHGVPETSAPMLKVIDGSIEALMETWSSVTMAMANEPVMLAFPANVIVFDPLVPGLVPVKVATDSEPVQAVPPPVSVKTLVAKPAVAVPAPQVTTGVPAKSAAKPV